MQALTLTAYQGWRWLAEGFRIYRKNPHFLALLLLCYWMVFLLLKTPPILGFFIAAVCTPIFSVGLMNACRDIDHEASPPPEAPLKPFPRRRPVLPVLFSGFGERQRPLLLLGAAYGAASFAVLAGTALFDGGLSFKVMLGLAPIDDKASVDISLLKSQQFWLLLHLPVVLAWWYTPLLVGWCGLSPAKALFFSCVAVLRNWRAFFAYGLCVLLVGVLLPLSVFSLLMLALPVATTLIAYIVTVLFLLVLAPSLVASFYVSYRDVFHIDTNA